MQKAKHAGKRAFLNVDRLVIDADTYTVAVLDKLPKDLDPKHVATPQVGDMMVFFGGQSPLSNFHQSVFDHQGVKYKWMEQLLDQSINKKYWLDAIARKLMKGALEPSFLRITA